MSEPVIHFTRSTPQIIGGTLLPMLPQTWAPVVRHPDLGEGQLPIKCIICCPYGHEGSLTDHEISQDGIVSPSCICPHEGCPWHDYALLDDWREPWQLDGWKEQA